MNEYFLLGVLGLWLIYLLLSKFLGKKRVGYSFIALFVFIIGYIYFYIYKTSETELHEYYTYASIGFFLLFLVLGNVRVFAKKNFSEFDFYGLERELNDIKDMSETLRQRFISTIELLDDGIAFRESDESIFGSDKFIELIGLDSNQFDVTVFENIMYKDDLIAYKNAIEKVTKRNPIYRVKYRVKIDDNLVWIYESGKLINIDKKSSYISIIKRVDIKQFPETEIEVLNSLKNEKKMYNEMQKLTRTKNPYHLVLIRLTNIPKINEKYGRDVGDLMMGEYIKKLGYNFIKDNTSFFRIGGIDFGLLIKDEKKYEILERALSGSGELLNLDMVFGGVTQTLYPNIGIAESPYLGKSPDKVLEEAKEALKISLKDQSHKNYCFYDKI